MSTLRISNIEAKSVPASATIDEKIKITNSSGDPLVFIDGKTSGITTVGINTTDGNIKFDANSNVVVTGIITATRFSGQITPTSLEIGSNIKLGNAGVITATSFVGSGANLTNLPAQVSITNNANDRVITGGSGTNLNGESRLTFDGNSLDISGSGSHPFSVSGGDFRNLVISGNSASSSGFIYLGNGAATNNADFDLGRIRIYNGATQVVQIAGSTDTSANDDGRLVFATRNTGGSLQERLRIDSSGRMQVSGTLGYGNMPLAGNPANAAIHIRCDSKYNGIAFGQNAVSGCIGMGGADTSTAMVFVANAHPANLGGGTKDIFEWWSGTAGGGGPGKYMSLNTGGHLELTSGNLEFASGNGIDFSANSDGGRSVDSDGNKLDDYEEGSWTPTMQTGSATISNAKYVKIGKLVHVSLYAHSFTDTSSSNIIQFNGLPFTSESSHVSTGALLLAYINTLNDSVAYIGGNETRIRLYHYNQGGDYTSLNHSAITSSNSQRRVFVSMTYKAGG